MNTDAHIKMGAAGAVLTAYRAAGNEPPDDIIHAETIRAAVADARKTAVPNVGEAIDALKPGTDTGAITDAVRGYVTARAHAEDVQKHYGPVRERADRRYIGAVTAHLPTLAEIHREPWETAAAAFAEHVTAYPQAARTDVRHARQLTAEQHDHMRAAEEAWAAMRPLLSLWTHLGTLGHGDPRATADARLLRHVKATTYKEVNDYNHAIKAGRSGPKTFEDFATLADHGATFWWPTSEEHTAAVARIEADAANWRPGPNGLTPVTTIKRLPAA